MKSKEMAQYNNRRLWERLVLSESNKERIKKSVEMIPSDVTSVADIGCGSGLFLNYIKENRDISKLIGIDFAVDAMSSVLTNTKVGDITKIPLKDTTYDLVSALEVLEHLDMKEFKLAKQELIRISKKYILISVPYNQDLELEFVKCSKCKTKFNSSHHKISFNEDDMSKLFGPEYRVKVIEYISKKSNYFLITPLLNFYRKKMRVKENQESVCPVCGYHAKSLQEQRQISSKEAKGKMFTFLKRIWPKSYTYKWILVLYEKVE